MSVVAIDQLHHDRRGAVMLTGLCMSCFLIGCLWFLIGIGDAIVFRDTMQEATDHATFTSAVLHAKGMNFISAINLVILALILVHIIMGIIHDVLLAVCILSFGFGCGAYTSWRNVYTTYGKIFKPIAGGLHYVEVAAAYGYPLLAAYKGYTLGEDYSKFGPKKHDMTMIVISPSLIPGELVDAGLSKLFTRKGKGPNGTDDTRFTVDNSKNSKSKKGLPVSAKKFSDMCDKVLQVGINALFNQSGSSDGAALTMAKGWLGGLLKVRYCNDLGSTIPDLTGRIGEANDAIDSANRKIDADNAAAGPDGKKKDKIANIDPGSGVGSGSTSNGGFSRISECMKDNSTLDPGFDKWWGCDGPLVPWSGTQNGSAWNQVYGLNWRPSYADDQEHAVALGGRKLGQKSTAESTVYFSEAEFYFDCSKNWSHGECNKEDNAAYSVRWRARLRRLEFPEIAELISSYAGAFLTSMRAYKSFSDKLKNGAKNKDQNGNVITEPGKGGNPILTGSFEGVVDALFKKYVTGKITSGGRDIGQYLNFNLGAYH